MTARTFSFVSLLALCLTGCPETVSCPEGFAMPDGEDECVALDGTDAGPQDAAPDAAGPCPTPCTGATPICDEENAVCIQCDADDASACTGDTPVCDVGTNTCVGCMEDDDCSDPTAARCVSGMCVGCNDSRQCAGIEGLAVCEPGAGTCVECTELEASACGGNPCTSENTCSDYGTAQESCEPCDTDDNCVADHFCVPLEWDGSSRAYCMLDTRAPGDCPAPYDFPISGLESLSGEAGLTVCGINETLTTCDAVLAHIARRRCPGGMDSECPDGGICRDTVTTSNLCTYLCQNAAQCSPSLPRCGPHMTAGPDFCGG